MHSGLPRLANEEELIKLLPGVYATIAGGEPYTERVFASTKDLKMVARFGVGWDQVDVAAATRHGVAVAMAFGGNHESVADGAFTLLAAVRCDLPGKHALVKSGGWGSGFDTGIWKKTLGIIGMGRIGRALARRCSRGFDMRVLAYDPMPDPAYAKANGIELTDLETLLRTADYREHPHPAHQGERELHQCRAAGADEAVGLPHQHGARRPRRREGALRRARRTSASPAPASTCSARSRRSARRCSASTTWCSFRTRRAWTTTASSAWSPSASTRSSPISRGEHPGAEYVLNPQVLPASMKGKFVMSVRSLDLKKRLRAGETTFGGWLTVANPVIAEIMAGTGFDWVVIDTEHGGFGNEGLMTNLIAFNGSPTVPIVRVPWNDAVRIKQILDMGADGVLVPMVNSPAEARAAVSACKYPSEGTRGFGPRRASDYGRKIDEYVAQANDGVVVILQIEHVDAVAQIDAILDTPGHRRRLPRPDRSLRLGRRAASVRASGRRRQHHQGADRRKEAKAARLPRRDPPRRGDPQVEGARARTSWSPARTSRRSARPCGRASTTCAASWAGNERR